MAINLATGSDYLSRTTALLAASGNRTWCAWVRQNTIPTAAQYNTYFASLDNTPATYVKSGGIVSTAVPTDVLDVDIPAGSNSLSTASALVGVWRHVTWTISGTTHTYYVDGVVTGTPFALDYTGFVAVTDVCGGDSLSLGNLQVAYVRQWTAALTVTQILTEMVNTSAQVTTGLWLDTPLASDLLDDSGLAHDWTQVGAGTFADQPALNVTAEGATAITVVPYTTVQYLTTIPAPNHEVWFKYSGVEHDHILSWYAFGYLNTNYIPRTKVYSGFPPVALSNLSEATNVPMIVPVTDGTDYYFRVRNVGGSEPLTGALNIAVQYGPTAAVPEGSLAINDDIATLPVVFLDRTTGDVLQVRNRFPTGDQGTLSANGTLLLENRPDSTLDILSDTLVAGAATPYPFSWTFIYAISNNGGETFYVLGAAGFTLTVGTISSAGVVGPTEWHPTGTVRGIAPSKDETILYYWTTGSSSVKRWSLITDTALSDLTGELAGYTTMVKDLLVQTDESIIVGRKRTSPAPTSVITHYSPAGVVLQTYEHQTAEPNRLTDDGDDAFWVWYFLPNGQDAQFDLIQISDGTVTESFVVPLFIGGVSQRDPGDGTLFGVSSSCPVWRVPTALSALTPPEPEPTPSPYLGTAETIPIRRLRRSPTVYDENKRLFVPSIELDAQVGVGDSTGEEEDASPELMIRCSKDGGMTWGNERRVTVGRIGTYGTRVIVHRWGSGRKFVWEIVSSTQANVVLNDLYLNVEQGES